MEISGADKWALVVQISRKWYMGSGGVDKFLWSQDRTGHLFTNSWSVSTIHLFPLKILQWFVEIWVTGTPIFSTNYEFLGVISDHFWGEGTFVSNYIECETKPGYNWFAGEHCPAQSNKRLGELLLNRKFQQHILFDKNLAEMFGDKTWLLGIVFKPSCWTLVSICVE